MGRGSAHEALVDSLSRRSFLRGAGTVALALAAGRLAAPPPALGAPSASDATLQAFADTMIPGRKATTTDLGNEIDPRAIAGVDPLPGGVEADALALYHHPEIGFDSLAPPFLADLQARSLPLGGDFLGLGWDQRVQVCLGGLGFDNPTRQVWEAAAAVPFTAFCAAAMIGPPQTAAKASGYRVMGLPGAAPAGYQRDFSYGRKLARERTWTGSLP
jgi:enediyne biosynthesis protein E8